MGDGIWIGMIAGLLLVMGGAAVAEVGPGALVYAAICLVLAAPFAWMAMDEFRRQRRGHEPRGFDVVVTSDDPPQGSR